MVFLELKRKSEEIFYWKSKQPKEVDFITKKGLKVDNAIQVAVSISDNKVKDREINAFIKAKKELHPNNFIILTEDEEGSENIKIGK